MILSDLRSLLITFISDSLTSFDHLLTAHLLTAFSIIKSHISLCLLILYVLMNITHAQYVARTLGLDSTSASEVNTTPDSSQNHSCLMGVRWELYCVQVSGLPHQTGVVKPGIAHSIPEKFLNPLPFEGEPSLFLFILQTGGPLQVQKYYMFLNSTFLL